MFICAWLASNASMRSFDAKGKYSSYIATYTCIIRTFIFVNTCTIGLSNYLNSIHYCDSL